MSPSETLVTIPSMVRIGSLAKASVGINYKYEYKAQGDSAHVASGVSGQVG